MSTVPVIQWHGTLMMNIYWCFLSQTWPSTLWVSNSILGHLLSCALHWAADTDCISAQGLHEDLLFSPSKHLCCRCEISLQATAAGGGEGACSRRPQHQWTVHLT